MEAAVFEKYGITAQMSEQQLLDCDYQNGECNGGWYDTAWKYVHDVDGIMSQKQYPYTGRKHVCMAKKPTFKISGCHGGPNSYCPGHGKIGDESVLKRMLNDRPVAVAVDADSFQFYSSGILRCGSSHRLNHAVFAVGYESNSHWIIKNSWGTSWGESGYVRTGMGGNPCGVADYPAYAIAA